MLSWYFVSKRSRDCASHASHPPDLFRRRSELRADERKETAISLVLATGHDIDQLPQSGKNHYIGDSTDFAVIKKLVAWFLVTVAALFLVAFWGLFLSPRPPLTTDPATLAGDGSVIDYCELPNLDGNGKLAADIPKGNTPGCGYTHFPLPILAECTEPLIEGADDIRGLWQATEGQRAGHVERVEQCGRRVVVTSSGVIHDYGPNSTLGENTNDVAGRVMFRIGDRPYCPRTSASMIWNNGILDFHVFGWGPVVVRRYRDGEQLVWEYVDGSVTRMNRICFLPEDRKVPKKR